MKDFLKKNFYTGLIAAIFLGVVAMAGKILLMLLYPLVYIAGCITKFTEHLFHYLSFPGVGYVVLIILLFILGMTINYWETKTGIFGRIIGGRLLKIPILNKIAGIFSSIKSTVSSWLTRKEDKKEKGFWVLIKWMPGYYSLAMTSYTSIAEINKAADEDLIAVLPNSCPIPATGATLLFTLRKNIIPLDIPFEVGWQLILSCGLLKLKDTKVELKKMSNAEEILNNN